MPNWTIIVSLVLRLKVKC